MDRRLSLVGVGALLSVLAALPSSLSASESAAPTTTPVAVTSSVVGLPGSTTTVPTTKTHRGQRRSVVIHVPDGLLAPAPLVVALHAHSQDTKAVRAYTRLERLADEQGFVVAFPEGASGSWNAGACCFPGTDDAVDDVGYLDEVLRIVRARVPIDPARISFTGGSNGAMMALRYACERPSVVASVAVVAGPFVATCTPSEPVAVLVIHGAKDRVVPLNGGTNAKLRTTFPPVDRSLEPFRKAGGEVRLAVVPRAAHEWMTRDKHGVDATGTVWAWMRDRPRALP